MCADSHPGALTVTHFLPSSGTSWARQLIMVTSLNGPLGADDMLGHSRQACVAGSQSSRLEIGGLHWHGGSGLRGGLQADLGQRGSSASVWLAKADPKAVGGTSLLWSSGTTTRGPPRRSRLSQMTVSECPGAACSRAKWWKETAKQACRGSRLNEADLLAGHSEAGVTGVRKLGLH